MKIYIDVSKIKIFQMELLENFMAKNDIEYARIYTIESIDERDKEIERLTLSYEDALEDLDKKENIIKEVREYITSYESIETIQQFDHNKNNKDLDYSTMDEMTRRYMMVHDKILKILDRS